jgi:4-hydroxy-2-oxoheptanedioate aldolase
MYGATDTTKSDGALRRRDLRVDWSAGNATLGCMLMIPSAFSAELVAAAGYDFVVVDWQHGLFGYEGMLAMVQAIGNRATPIVRVSWNEPSLIMRALDAGADGVIVPMVNSAAEARAAALACRYAPAGNRSWGPTRSALGIPDFGPQMDNDRVICAVMIETVEAVEAADEILAVPGIDVAFVGPADLSLSRSGGLEAPGRTPADSALIEKVMAAAQRHDVVLGTAVSGHEPAQVFLERGFKFVAVHNDAGLLVAAARETLLATTA